VTVSDLCDANPAVTLLGCRCSGPDARGENGTLVAGADFGTDDRMIQLRADKKAAASTAATASPIASRPLRNVNLGSALVSISARPAH